MKRITKTIMAFLTAMTMTMGAMSVTAYAESEKQKYTYAELLEMNKNEFLELPGAENIYDFHAKHHSAQADEEGKYYNGFEMTCNIFSSKTYKPYECDTELKELFNGFSIVIIDPLVWDISIDGKIESPYSTEWACRLAESDTLGNDNITKYKQLTENSGDDDILELSKFEYCVKQVINAECCQTNKLLNNTEATDIGDADRDGWLTVRDAAIFARKLAVSEKIDNGDVNLDGKVNVRDCSQLAKMLAVSRKIYADKELDSIMATSSMFPEANITRYRTKWDTTLKTLFSIFYNFELESETINNQDAAAISKDLASK